MPTNEMFDSALCSTGELAGVFEHDGDTGYFYLYQTKNNDKKVVAAIHVITGVPDFDEEDIKIMWDVSERIVGLFIKHQLWAAFDGTTGAKYGGNYDPDALPLIPVGIAHIFESK